MVMAKEPLTDGGLTISVPDQLPLIAPWKGLRVGVVGTDVTVIVEVAVTVTVAVVVEIAVVVTGDACEVEVTVVVGPVTVTVLAEEQPVNKSVEISRKTATSIKDILAILRAPF